MSQIIDITQFFTRRQSDNRYLKQPQVPNPPTALALHASGIIQTAVDIRAYLDISLTPPSTPTWNTAPQYVQGYRFTYTYVSLTTVTRDVVVPYNSSNIYRIDNLPTGLSVSIVASTIDYSGQIGPVSSTLATSTPADTTPPAARVISVTPVAGGAAVVSLDSVNTESDFDHYELWRGEGSSPSTVSWGSSPIILFNASIIEDRSIPTTASDYYYKVVSKDFSGNGATSNIAGPFSLLATEGPPPGAPSLGTITPNSDGSLTIAWAFSGAPAGFYVWRRSHGSVPWILLDNLNSISGGTGTYTDLRAINGTNYDYTVTSYNSVGSESAFPSSPGFLTATSADTLPPNPAGAIAVTGRLGGVYVIWTVSSSISVASYGVSFRLNALSAYSSEERVDANQITLLGFTTSRDQLANNLQIRVIAYDQVGNASSPSTYLVQFPDLAAYQPAGNTVPAGPLNLSAAKNDDSSVLLSWPASVTGSRSGYQIEKYDSQLASWDIEGTMLNNLPGTISYLVRNLEPFSYRGKQYRFRARTLDYSGNISSVNLAENPGFELGSLSDWTLASDAGASSAVVTTPVHSGTYAITANQASRPSQVIAVSAGFIYTWSAYMASNGVTSAAPILKIEWLQAGGALSAVHPGDTSSSLTPISSYQQLSVSGTAPSDAVNARVYLYGDSANPTVTFVWDDAQFEQQAAASAFNNARTELINAIDQVAPQDYSNVSSVNYLNITATGALGAIELRWDLPPASFTGAFEYIDSVFEVWRQVTISSQPTLPVDTTFRKIATVQGGLGPSLPAVAIVAFNDDDPAEAYNVTASYKLKSVDRFGNTSGFLNGGVAVSSKSLTPNDVQIAAKDGLTPTTPTGPSATAGTDGTISVSWTGSTTAGRNDLAGYYVYRRRNGTGSYQQVKSIFTNAEGGTVSWIDSGLDLSSSGSTSTTYDYKISAFDTGLEESSQSSATASVTPIDNRVPNPPSGVLLKGTVGGLQISWTPSTTQGVVKYKVSVPSVAGGTAIAVDVTGTSMFARLDGGPTSAQITASGFYSAITVQAYSVSGGTLSSAASPSAGPDTTTYVAVDLIPPNPPTNVTVSSYSGGTAVISWSPSSSNDVFSYVIEMTSEIYPASGLPGPWAGVGSVLAPTTSFMVSGLQPTIVTGTRYQFRVKAIDHSNNVSSSPDPVMVDISSTCNKNGIYADGATFSSGGSLGGFTYSRDLLPTVTSTINLIPDSDGALLTWSFGADSSYTYSSTGGAIRGGKWTYVGTGSASGFHFLASTMFFLAPGTKYTLSGYVDATNVSSGRPGIAIESIDVLTSVASVSQTAGQSGRISITFVLTTSQPVLVRAVFDTFNCTVNNAQNLVFSNLQLEAAGLASSYISSDIFPSLGGNGVVMHTPAVGVNNVIACSGQSVTLPSGSYASIVLVGAGLGNQTGQTFVVHYTDSTTDSFSVNLSDWATPQGYAGETTITTISHRDKSDGTLDQTPVGIHAYVLDLNQGKTASSLSLPNNTNVIIAEIGLLPIHISDMVVAAGVSAPPSTPSGVMLSTALESDTQTTTALVSVSWTRVPDRDLNYYVLEYYRTDGVGGHTSLQIPAIVAAQTIRSLKINTAYGFLVYSVDLYGNRSAPSSLQTITTANTGASTTAAGSPTITSITQSDSPPTATIAVNFQVGTGGANNNLSYASIRRATSSQSGTNVGPEVGTVAIPSNASSGAAFSFTDTAYQNGDLTAYTLYYKVVIMNTAGVASTPSSESTISIPGYYDGGTGDPSCPASSMYLPDGKQLADVIVGDNLVCLEDGSRVLGRSVLERRGAVRKCVKLYTDNGCSGLFSESTPFVLPDGSQVRAPEMEGRSVATFLDGHRLEWTVCHVADAGLLPVVYIYAQDAIYACGSDPDKCIFSHNTLPRK